MNIITLIAIHFTLAHDFHLCKSEIQYDREDRAVEIILHIFTDDLETAVLATHDEELKLFTDQPHPDADDILVDYLSSNFSIQEEGHLKPWTYLGIETSEDLAATLIYLEISDTDQPESLRITNKILMDIFEDQKNLMVLRIKGENAQYKMMKQQEINYEWKL